MRHAPPMSLTHHGHEFFPGEMHPDQGRPAHQQLAERVDRLR
jgi:hypothetical protein